MFLAILPLTACGAVSTSEPTIEPTPVPAIEAEPTPTSEVEPAPAFYFGVDLSYVNEMDDCGAVYLENGETQDAYLLFSRHGANLVRARLWHNPDWTEYSTVPDIKRTFSRAEEAGMRTLLDFHYSDNWADPSKQAIPAAWQGMDDDELGQAVYEYTHEVLTELHENGLMPDFVQVGNETNSGMLKQVMEIDWQRDAELFNAGIRAVRDVADATNTNPKVILHVAQPENAGWWFREATANGISEFDIIGLSYYPQWSSYSITDLGAHVTYLRQTFNKDVMIVETAYPWTLDAVDETADNILNQGIRGYSFSVEGQRQYMIDLTQSLISNGGLGVVYWEPAWVSTQCSTRWGQGSHWENATFFDFQNDNELHEGIDFLSYDYTFPAVLVDGVVEDSYGEALVQDAVDDNLGRSAAWDLVSLHADEDADSVFIALTIAGDIYEEEGSSYLLYLDITNDAQGAAADVGKRPITVADPFKPEYRLDVRIVERKGTISGSYTFYVWDGNEWQHVTLTGGAAIQNGTPSVIEFQIPKATLGYPSMLNVDAVSTDRGRVHTAADILSSDTSPSDSSEPVVLDSFAHLELSTP
ncbi:MAG: glycosyl hydrolase 53 family protein [Anaerolineae bacterium]|nr:glycosyl hydrolase 53 family protein [Anaerolineae bacterium]